MLLGSTRNLKRVDNSISDYILERALTTCINSVNEK